MDKKLYENAKIVLEAACRAKAGETVLMVADEKLLPYASALASAAVELGLIPAIIDITHFLSSPAYNQGRLMEPLKAAMESADIVIGNTKDVHDPNRADFSRLVGDPDVHDSCLTAERRWVYLQCNGLEKWNITKQQVVKLRERTHWLQNLLKSSKAGRITSPLGTDFSFELGPDASYVPVLGIVPLYAEVAVVPSLKATSGVFVVDGPTQLDTRPAYETAREPLCISVEAGRVVDMTGDAVQLERLKAFIASGDPPADAVDEVGIITTHFEDNDKYYWSDGTHHHDRVHIALGNNVRRDVVVHGPRHMDCEINKPTISIDGLVVVEDGIFLDEAMNTAS
jgi:leucyl aminopeptidase (aminopeptidase T)